MEVMRSIGVMVVLLAACGVDSEPMEPRDPVDPVVDKPTRIRVSTSARVGRTPIVPTFVRYQVDGREWASAVRLDDETYVVFLNHSDDAYVIEVSCADRGVGGGDSSLRAYRASADGSHVAIPCDEHDASRWRYLEVSLGGTGDGRTHMIANEFGDSMWITAENNGWSFHPANGDYRVAIYDRTRVAFVSHESSADQTTSVDFDDVALERVPKNVTVGQTEGGGGAHLSTIVDVGGASIVLAELPFEASSIVHEVPGFPSRVQATQGISNNDGYRRATAASGTSVLPLPLDTVGYSSGRRGIAWSYVPSTLEMIEVVFQRTHVTTASKAWVDATGAMGIGVEWDLSYPEETRTHFRWSEQGVDSELCYGHCCFGAC
jgi:hypothetical protein